MLATLAFILLAYGMYALFSLFTQRKGGNLRGRSRWRYGWLPLAGGIGGGVALISWLYLAPDQDRDRLRLSGFLGTVYAEGAPDKLDRRLEYPPVKGEVMSAGSQPVYALLHPETPVSQANSEKKPLKPRPLRKPKVEKSSPAPAKVAKAAPTAVKKDNLAAKSKAKKKKPAAAAGSKKVSG